MLHKEEEYLKLHGEHLMHHPHSSSLGVENTFK